MSDLDFDELDRAVNSLISNTPDTKATDATSAPVAVNVSQPVVTAEPKAPEPVALSSPSLAGRRSSGRFMDVVHPLSDMRSTNIPRRTPNLTDSQSSVTPTVVVAPVSLVEETKPEATISIDKNAWPDPIDFHESNSAPENIVVPNPSETVDVNQITPDSPFIPGTKVEKRPLGAFSVEPTVSNPVSEVIDNNDNSKSEEINPPLPAELQDDLLSIESGNSTSTSELSTIESQKSDDIDNQPDTTDSINQQYNEQPSTGDQKTGAIYDTNVYHKALTPSEKKKSGWNWVIWIIILLIVCAGSGAAFYFFVLPRL